MPDSKEILKQREPSALYTDLVWLDRCSSEINKRLTGKDPKTAKTFRNDKQYLTTAWTQGVNLTAVAMAQGTPRPVAITPKHLVSTKHYGWHPWPGQTVNFLTSDNQIISRTVDKVMYLGSADNHVLDLDVAVARLTEDLPSSITPMKIISPAAVTDVAQGGCPVLRIDQENKALLVKSSTQSKYSNWAYFQTPNPNASTATEFVYAKYYESMVIGDSTSSSIIIYKDQFGITPFLLSQVTFAGVGLGPNYSALSTKIQEVITGFGDTDLKYKIGFGPNEFTSNPPPSGNTAPRCNLIVDRNNSTGVCSVTVNVTGQVSGAPTMSPAPSSQWTRNANSWATTANCKTKGSYNFNATVSGPYGKGSCSGGLFVR
jgi:hypothetical protein